MLPEQAHRSADGVGREIDEHVTAEDDWRGGVARHIGFIRDVGRSPGYARMNLRVYLPSVLNFGKIFRMERAWKIPKRALPIHAAAGLFDRGWAGIAGMDADWHAFKPA